MNQFLASFSNVRLHSNPSHLNHLLAPFGASLLGRHKPAKYALEVFVPVLIYPKRGLGVAYAGRERAHRLVVQHVRLSRLLHGLQTLEHRRGDLDRVLEPLRYSSPPYLPTEIIALLSQG